MEKTGQIFDLMKLALETDSTRIISLFIDTTVIHNITHHGGRPEVIAELRGHEERQFEVLTGFLTALADGEGRRRQPARPDAGPLRHLHGQRELAQQRQPARPPRRRRLQTRPAPRLRHDEQSQPRQPLCLDAPAPRHRDRHLRQRADDDARAGDGVTDHQNPEGNALVNLPDSASFRTDRAGRQILIGGWPSRPVLQAAEELTGQVLL